MNGELDALTAEISRLADMVEGLVQRLIAVEAIWEAGKQSARQDA